MREIPSILIKWFIIIRSRYIVGVDLYTGNIFSQPAIQLPADTYFENFTYSCADTAIYGLARKNYYSTYYDSLLQMTMTVFDSATSRLSKIDPNTGE
ncbi:MAG: hypothetical protein IPH46_07455 [Bacteroidetes bacterium]|nr:hypothetical protein [Bacteroidota bacterium]